MEDGINKFYQLFREVDGDYYPGSAEFLRWLEDTDFSLRRPAQSIT